MAAVATLDTSFSPMSTRNVDSRPPVSPETIASSAFKALCSVLATHGNIEAVAVHEGTCDGDTWLWLLNYYRAKPEDAPLQVEHAKLMDEAGVPRVLKVHHWRWRQSETSAQEYGSLAVLDFWLPLTEHWRYRPLTNPAVMRVALSGFCGVPGASAWDGAGRQLDLLHSLVTAVQENPYLLLEGDPVLPILHTVRTKLTNPKQQEFIVQLVGEHVQRRQKFTEYEHFAAPPVPWAPFLPMKRALLDTSLGTLMSVFEGQQTKATLATKPQQHAANSNEPGIRVLSDADVARLERG